MRKLIALALVLVMAQHVGEKVPVTQLMTPDLPGTPTPPVEELAEAEIPCEFTYTAYDVVCLAKLAQGEAGGLDLMERSAVIWCALNYLDGWNDNIIDAVKARNRFTGYHEGNKVTDENLWLAQDVLDRYVRELKGDADVGRTLPKGYICFRGFKWQEKATELGLTKAKYSHNWFFKAEEYRKDKYERNYWDWSLGSPY